VNNEISERANNRDPVRASDEELKGTNENPSQHSHPPVPLSLPIDKDPIFSKIFYYPTEGQLGSHRFLKNPKKSSNKARKGEPLVIYFVFMWTLGTFSSPLSPQHSTHLHIHPLSSSSSNHFPAIINIKQTLPLLLFCPTQE
jgi:hypothetical protein